MPEVPAVPGVQEGQEVPAGPEVPEVPAVREGPEVQVVLARLDAPRAAPAERVVLARPALVVPGVAVVMHSAAMVQESKLRWTAPAAHRAAVLRVRLAPRAHAAVVVALGPLVVAHGPAAAVVVAVHEPAVAVAAADVAAVVVVVADVAVAAVAVEATSKSMHTIPSTESKASLMNISRMWSLGRRLGLALILAAPLCVAAATQENFATPEAAVEALMAALKADSDPAMFAIFGEEHKDVLLQSDRAATSATRARILAAMQTLHVLREPAPDRRVLVIGDQAWPVPIPIVRVGDRWRFATEEGVDEVVNRIVGGNERNAIYVLRAYIDAQRAYAARDRDGDGVLQYAQKIASTPGKHDGLYWPDDATADDEPSPFGPLIAANPYLKGHVAGDPYRGYYFRILMRQGNSAPGGAYNYVINGRMIAGFAMVAFPAEYGKSGVMSFIVSHNGKVYEKNLGKNSLQVGAKMTTFDPGAGWTEVPR